MSAASVALDAGTAAAAAAAAMCAADATGPAYTQREFGGTAHSAEGSEFRGAQISCNKARCGILPRFLYGTKSHDERRCRKKRSMTRCFPALFAEHPVFFFDTTPKDLRTASSRSSVARVSAFDNYELPSLESSRRLTQRLGGGVSSPPAVSAPPATGDSRREGRPQRHPSTAALSSTTDPIPTESVRPRT